MAFTKVNETYSGAVHADYYTNTLAIPTVTTGNMLVATFLGPMGITSVSGGGVTWAKILDYTSGGRVQVWVGLNSSGATTPTIKTVGSGGYFTMYDIVEVSWSGGNTSGAIIEVGTAGLNTATGTGSNYGTGTITPTSGLDAILFAISGGTSTVTNVTGVSSGWTELGNSPNTVGGMAYRTASSTSGSYSASWVFSNVYVKWAGAIMAISMTSHSTGQVKVWNGSSFVAKPANVWNGTSWIVRKAKVWNGSVWVTTNY